MAFNAGHFSNPKYDTCAYPEDLYESTAPYAYVMNTDRIHNCRGSLTVFGPRSSYNGAGASSPTGDVIAAAQENVDIDSIMSNRNVPLSKCKRGKVNPVDVMRIKTKDIPVSNDYLDGQHSRMFDPAMFYRGVAVNRFYDLNKDPQANIFYDWAVNTSLEAKDNFVPELPTPMTDVDMVPVPPNAKRARDDWVPCSIALNVNGNCGTKCKNGKCDDNCENRCVRKERMTRNAKNNILNQVQYRGNGNKAGAIIANELEKSRETGAYYY
jgi:hypothetical protein